MQETNTSFYPGISAQNADPLSQAAKAIQLRNAVNNITKIQGGMNGTQGALSQLGAGQPYQPTPTQG